MELAWFPENRLKKRCIKRLLVEQEDWLKKMFNTEQIRALLGEGGISWLNAI